MPSNKEKSLFSRKEAIRPWPNLPQQLLKLLAKKRNMLRQLSYPGTTKSWTNTTKRCNGNKHPKLPQIHDLEGYNYKWRCSGKTDGMPWSIRGWHADVPFKRALSSSSWEGLFLDTTEVVLTGISSPSLVVDTLIQGQYKRVKHDIDTIDPYDAKKQPMLFTTIIDFEGKYYALSLQGALAIMEEAGSSLVIKSIGKNRAVPCAGAKYFKEYFLESNGEILLVFLIYRKTLSVVDEVEVFRLHFAKLEWVKVERLEERALFLESECCIWVNSSQVGCRGNSVYFTQSTTIDQWFTYDMESGCISPGLTIDME